MAQVWGLSRMGTTEMVLEDRRAVGSRAGAGRDERDLAATAAAAGRGTGNLLPPAASSWDDLKTLRKP